MPTPRPWREHLTDDEAAVVAEYEEKREHVKRLSNKLGPLQFRVIKIKNRATQRARYQGLK